MVLLLSLLANLLTTGLPEYVFKCEHWYSRTVFFIVVEGDNIIIDKFQSTLKDDLEFLSSKELKDPTIKDNILKRKNGESFDLSLPDSVFAIKNESFEKFDVREYIYVKNRGYYLNYYHYYVIRNYISKKNRKVEHKVKWIDPQAFYQKYYDPKDKKMIEYPFNQYKLLLDSAKTDCIKYIDEVFQKNEVKR